MTIFRHEIRQNLRTAVVWALGCAVLLLVTMSVFPRVKNSVGMVEKLIEGMGPLARAFAMDKLDYGTVMGYYATQSDAISALAGALFASILAGAMLAKEEGRHTAEYLFPHPVSRFWVLVQKFLAMLALLILFVLINAGLSLLGFRMLGESWDRKDFLEIQLALLTLMLSMACICWAFSAFLTHESLGLGIGLALLMYFLNLLINLDAGIDALRLITPFHATQAADLVGPAGISQRLLRQWAGISAGMALLGFARYLSKDLRI